MRKSDRPPTILGSGMSLRWRICIANGLGVLIVVLGGSICAIFGFLVVLYYLGGIELIQEILVTGDSKQLGAATQDGKFIFVIGGLIGIFIGGYLSAYLASWLIVKIGLLTKEERGPIEFTLDNSKKSE